MEQGDFKIGLVGNPNCGKSSLFNLLTGLRQKVGNYPGITIDKKIGTLKINGQTASVIDFPGAYSLYPNSEDERVVLNVFTNPQGEDFPDLVVYVAEITNLEKHLLLLTQIIDLRIPVILALNMIDLAEQEGIEYDTTFLSRKLRIPVVAISSKMELNIDILKSVIKVYLKDIVPEETGTHKLEFYRTSPTEKKVIDEISKEFGIDKRYQALLWAHHYKELPFLSKEQKKTIATLTEKHHFQSLKYQIEETMARFNAFLPLLKDTIQKKKTEKRTLTDKIDDILTHNVLGPIIFFAIIFFVFQAVFSWATYPMELIDNLFGHITQYFKTTLPAGWGTDLLTDGILAGLGGIVIFIPQIAILFLLISLMEEMGYMARTVYLFDKIMQRFGLNGRSVVALVSGGACAIPAIMTTRTIGYWKERLLTILVTPFISCSARIPVYAVLIGLTIPNEHVLGIFNLQGLAFMGLYILGVVTALLAALVLKNVIRTHESSFLALELPDYKLPLWKNIFINVWEKVRSFILNAGKIILVISVVLWFLASYGPAQQMQQATAKAVSQAKNFKLSKEETANLIAANRLEASYAGHFGKWIEPAIRPLGYDWKIGIALLTSFAAREVFIGTISTIYSIGSEDRKSVTDYIKTEINPSTGEKVFSRATSFSLLIFYVFAMQCMATFAVVKRETKRWKWPILQFVFMTVLAYVSSFLVYQLMR